MESCRDLEVSRVFDFRTAVCATLPGLGKEGDAYPGVALGSWIQPRWVCKTQSRQEACAPSCGAQGGAETPLAQIGLQLSSSTRKSRLPSEKGEDFRLPGPWSLAFAAFRPFEGTGAAIVAS